MTILLLIAGLGLALGLVFRVTLLIVVSAAAAIALFAASYSAGGSVLGSALNAFIGLLALQIGYFGGVILRYLFGSLARGQDHRDAERVRAEEVSAASELLPTPARFKTGTPEAARSPDAETGLERQVLGLVREAPGFVLMVHGPDHLVEGANDAFHKLANARPVIGKPLRETLPELADQELVALLDDVYRGNRGQKRHLLQLRTRRDSDAADADRIVDVVCEPLRDADGNAVGVFVEGEDVTATVRADARYRELEQLSKATIDALAEHIAVIQPDGTVARVNKAWGEFAEKQGPSLPGVTEGANYLAICDQAAAAGNEDARQVSSVIRSVLSGGARQGQWEYEHQSTEGPRWFLLKVNRFSGAHPEGAVITQEDVTDRKANERRIEYLATHDALTRLPNRNLLEDRTRQAIERARRSSQRLALIAIDLDNFKQLNEAYGHAVGDATIETCASRIAEAAREQSDTVARLGSDEFVVVLADGADPATAASRVARAIQSAVKSPMTVLADQEFTLSASVGISLYPADGETLDTLLKNAQAALHRAKALGRGGYQFYSPEMSARANERVIFEGELRRALSREQFELHFQPQVALETGALIGVEALLRWKHPELGWLQPGRFIPIAEETGLIDPLGRYVLREACLQSRAWQREGVPPVPVAVNIAAAQLRHADFLSMVTETIEETGIDPKSLELEITEGTMMEVTEPLLSRIDSLKQLGVRLSIDDFGTGYSNLAYLRTFPLDRLKIDKSFIASAPHDEGSESIVRAIIGLGESLGLEVVAEGVETADQAAVLNRLGCRQAQGYLYGKPMPAADLIAWVRARGEGLGTQAAARR